MMKTYEKITENKKNLKTCGNMLSKAGYGLKTAAFLGYKAGYNVGKYPNLEKVKNAAQKHPKAGIFLFLGIISGFVTLTGLLIRKVT